MSDFPRANYGPTERPRACVICGYTESRVQWTETYCGVLYRHRVCRGCGEKFTTSENKLAPQGVAVA